MPKAWTQKDERQYQHIKHSLQQQGKTVDQSEKIAARTVNKQRREEGRTPNRSSQGTGNPNKQLEARTKQELYNRAKQLNIAGRSSMNKAGLIQAIRKRG